MLQLGSIIISDCNNALHVSDAFCVHPQEHLKTVVTASGLQEVGESCGDWMELAQDRDRWRALVSTVRNLLVPKMRGIS